MHVKLPNSHQGTAEHFANIDLIRFVAALSIIVFHLFGEFTIVKYTNTTLTFFLKRYAIYSSGVDLFFVISGFVIVRGLSSRNISPAIFLKGRARRIVPIYWIVTATTLLLTLLTNLLGISKIHLASARQIFESLFFFATYSKSGHPIVQQGWTLEYEVAFYLIISGFLIFAKTFLRNLFFLAGVVLFSICVPSHRLFLEFAAGITIGLLPSTPLKFRKINYILILGSLSILSFIFARHISVSDRLFYTIPYGILLYAAVNAPQLRSNVVLWLGKISYPVYLSQGLVIPVIYQYIKPLNQISSWELLGVFFAGINLSLLLGISFYHYIDRPITEKLKRIGW